MSSIFLDERAQQYAATISNSITIGPVTGILKENLQFSVEANWENIFSLNDQFADVQKFGSAFLGVGVFNTGVWTKKFYKGGNYLRINPKMRVVDWDGDNSVISQASTLTDLCLPSYKGGSVEQQVKEVVGKIQKITKKNVGQVIKKGFSKVKEEAAQIIDEGVGSLASDAGDKITGLIKNIYSNSPQPVRVRISNFFDYVFIVESVQVEFSKEMTENGPLYADFELVLSAPEVTTRGRTGLKTPSQSRFTRN